MKANPEIPSEEGKEMKAPTNQWITPEKDTDNVPNAIERRTMEPQKTCCSCSLRTGTIITATFSLLFTLGMSFFPIVILTNNKFGGIYDQAMLVTFLVILLLSSVTSITLLAGAIERNETMLLICLIIQGISLGSAAVFSIILIALHYFISGSLVALGSGIGLLLWRVAYRFHEELKEGAQGPESREHIPINNSNSLMMGFKTCFFGVCSLRTGAMAIAILEIVLAFGSSIPLAVYISQGGQEVSATVDLSSQKVGVKTRVPKELLITLLIICIQYCAASIILLVGAIKRNKTALLIWLIIQGILFVKDPTYCIAAMLTGKYVAVEIGQLIACGIAVYAWLVVYGFYKEVAQAQNTQGSAKLAGTQNL